MPRPPDDDPRPKLDRIPELVGAVAHVFLLAALFWGLGYVEC